MNRNETDLSYFIRLHNENSVGTPSHTRDKWDRRAERWEKEYNAAGIDTPNDRVGSAADYLRSRGLLGPDCDVADIGCGPGRFAAAFAETARSVTGFDLSERMIHYAAEHVKRLGLDNVSFRVCDFQTLDIEAEGLAGRFDLVFSSVTPAIHGMNGLEKIMKMSRAFCCDITHISSENDLESRIMRELFRRERPRLWDGRWLYSLFNVLFLSGYCPEVTYYQREKKCRVRPDLAYAERFMEQMLPTGERTEKNAARICDWLRENADADGLVEEVSNTLYGRTLWDVRMKTERPDYRPAE